MILRRRCHGQAQEHGEEKDCPNDRVFLQLGPVEVQGAFFFSMGMTISGGKVIHKYV